ncbi:LysR family transcriptional regulator [Bordetella sp. 02P26C-1]|uniref:LysR family transcriptional regulator n=1 Tax=Bordetella sp. 02P26C-1 TaxID=2683195 RepID=UPI001921E11F|nr:LysR family transcriptional regulator [Bordetella sp. 02P26C-1]
MIELRHFRCFIAVAETLHFGRAAERLAMSQPPLTVAIQQLEQRLGTRLFERNSKGVRLTAAGQAMLEDARRVLGQFEQALVHARDAAEGISGHVRIGCVGAMLYRGLPQALASYQHDFPAVRVTVSELNSQIQVTQLLRDELDVGFVHTARLPKGMQRQLVVSEPFICCLPADHALAAQPRIPLSTLADEPFVLFARSVSPDYHAAILDVCAQAGFSPRLQHEVRHWLAVVAWVAQGLGVALVPKAMSQSGVPGVVFRPIDNAVAMSESYVIWREDGATPVAGHCVEHLKQFFNEHKRATVSQT